MYNHSSFVPNQMHKPYTFHTSERIATSTTTTTIISTLYDTLPFVIVIQESDRQMLTLGKTNKTDETTPTFKTSLVTVTKYK